VANWDVEFTDEFGEWWDGLTGDEQESVTFGVDLLGKVGPGLDYPYSSSVYGSTYGGRMRELRIQHEGRPYRVLYVFDPRRTAICSSVATRPARIVGMRKTCQSQTGSTKATWRR